MIPLILASKSASRSAILAGAGVAFQTVDSGVDETAIKDEMLAAGASPAQIAQALADAKALKVASARDGLVIGADQTLDLAGALHDKAASLDEARERLKEMRGRAHHLHAGLSLARDGEIVWRHLESSHMTMRSFSDAWLDHYLTTVGEDILGSVGCYHLEGMGAQLFEAIDGDYFAILGLPLLPLLAQLRQRGAIDA